MLKTAFVNLRTVIWTAKERVNATPATSFLILLIGKNLRRVTSPKMLQNGASLFQYAKVLTLALLIVFYS